MSAKLVDVFTVHAQGREYRPERRKRARTNVHWPVLLLRDQGFNPIDTVTQNLSSSGFYCFSSTPVAPGAVLRCSLKVPAHDPKGEQRTVTLECRVQVLRSEAAQDGSFGIACRIEDYHLIARGVLLA
jgi:hypothetical protein